MASRGTPASVPRAATRRLVEAAQRGDPCAQDTLIRRYEPLIQRTVQRLNLPPRCEREDLAQEARLGLLAAMRAWRPERGPFPAFAEQCVRNLALLAVKAASRHKHQVLNRALSLEEPLYAESLANQRPAVRLIDLLANPQNAPTNPESRLLLHEQIDTVLRALPTLTAAERAALSGGLSEQTREQVAKTLQVTPKGAAQAAYRARRKLAKALPRAA